MAVPDKQTRDANLDALQAAADQYLQTEIDRLDNETRFLRTVLTARGANEVAALNVNAGANLVQAEVDDFLLIS